MRLRVYVSLCAAVGLLSVAGVSGAAEPSPSGGADRSAPVVRDGETENPHLAALEKRLREVVLPAQPAAVFRCTPYGLWVRYRSDQYAAHLTDANGSISKEPAARFPDDFSEFELYLCLPRDVTYYRPDSVPVYERQTFGTTLSHRYNLQVAADTSPPIFDAVPDSHWVYREYEKLFRAGFVPDWRRTDTWSGPPSLGWFSRMEFAAHTARLTDLLKRGALEKPMTAEAADALTFLQAEFAPEIALLEVPVKAAKPTIHGQNWQPRYWYVSLRFSYGKGVPADFVDRVTQAVAAYAQANLRAGAATPPR